MVVKNGYLLISDISGYTQFLVSSELQHAKEILDTLLRTGVESIHPPIRVLNTRRDAEELEPLFREAAQDALRRLAEILEEAREPDHR